MMTTQTLDDYRLLMIGVPATGKTSFLAALWHLVESDFPRKSWYQYKYGTDIDYMNRIRNRWIECKPQDRTNQEQLDSRNVDLFLENTKTGQRLTINVPDIAGEQFSQQWVTRSWSKAYDQLVSSTNGLLFFLNPDNVKSPVLLTDTAVLAGGFLDTSGESIKQIWKPDLAPSQVVAVDLLQFHLPMVANPKIASIAIIISAWDTVLEQDESLTPDKWLAENMPLLHQYLNANEDEIRFAVFGISAQGGDYNQKIVQQTLTELEEPAQRVIVQEQNTRHHNLMAPIEWSMQAWK